MGRKRQVAFGVTALSAGLVGCGAGDSGTSAPPYQVRDSAGIEIVEVSRPEWPEGGGWRIAPDRLLEIGAAEGEEPYQLFRATNAVRLANGSIVVANRGTQELRWFGPDGRWIRSTGGEGEGPGEFDSLFSLRILGDTLVAHDFRVGRVTRYDTAGVLLETVQLDRAPGLPIDIWPTSAGFTGRVRERIGDIHQDATYARIRSVYLRYPRDGSAPDTIDVLPGEEMLVRGGPVPDGFVMSMASPLIGHGSMQAVVGDRLVAGITDRFEIRVYGPDGRLERLIRDPARDLPVTDGEWNAIVDQALAEAETPDARRSVLELAEQRPAPDTRPAYDAFIGDRLGYLWVAPYRPEPGKPVPWLVIDPDGGVLGTVDLPEGLRPTDIGEDWVVGVVVDELDIQRVRVYRLTRTP
jgi:hypothetical protein